MTDYMPYVQHDKLELRSLLSFRLSWGTKTAVTHTAPLIPLFSNILSDLIVTIYM